MDRTLGIYSLLFAFLLISNGQFLIHDTEAAPPARGYLDVAISELRWSSRLGERAWPGAQIKINISLGHDMDPIHSDTPVYPEDNLRLLIVIDDGFHNITTIYHSISTLNLSYSLDKNGTFNPYYFEFDWWANITISRSGGNIEGDVSLSATLLISDNDTSDNGISVVIPVRHLESQPFIWEDGQDDGKYESPAPHWVDVGDAVNIPFELQNNGREIDTFEFVVLSIPKGWDISLGGPYTVFPNDEIQIEMFVIVSDNPFEAEAVDEHRIVVKVRSIYEPNRTYSQPSVHAFLFKVRFMASAELYPESDNVYLTPGDAHQVYFWLRNIGNGEDDYTLKAIIDDEHIRKGWNVAFESGTRQPTVKPDQYFKIILRVNVPVYAPLNYVVILTLSIWSMNIDYNTTSDPCSMFTDIRHAAKIEEFDEPFDVEPGEFNQIQFNFTNDGNSRDPTLDLSISYKPKGWSVEMNLTPLTEGGGIGPKTMVLMDMSIFVEETAVASSKGSLPFIVIQARGGEYQHLLAEERYYFRIPLRHKVDMQCDMDRIIGSSGEDVQFNFTLENRGNWLDTFNVSVDGIEIVFDVDPSVTELAPGEVLYVRAAFLIPWNWPADSDLSTPWPTNGTMFDPYRIQLKARSQNETVPDSSLVQHPIELFILPRYDIEIKVVDGPILKVPYDHDQSRTFLVEVKNTGNANCEMDISLEGSYTWVDIIGETVPLDFNETRFIPIYLKYRAFDMNEYDDRIITLNITIKGMNDNSKYFTCDMEFLFLPYTFHIEIVEVVDPDWTMDGSYLVHFGENQSFRVLVVREGQFMYLPDDMDGPYIVMYIDDVERVRLKIPSMEPGNKTYIDFGPMQILFKGRHVVNFTIEGMGSDSLEGFSMRTVVLVVESTEDDDKEKGRGSILPLVIGILTLIMMIGMIGAGIFIYFKWNRDGAEDIETNDEIVRSENKKELERVPGLFVGPEHHEGNTSEE